MATEQVSVIEGDGSSDSVTVTDDPVEDATVESVQKAIGDETTGSVQEDPTLAATLQELVAGLSALLRGALTGKDNDDEVRVRIQEQNGDVSVSLGSESVTIDSLPSIDIASQSAGIATDSTLSDLNAAIGDGEDTAETNETNTASLLAFVKGAVKLLGGTLTVTDNGSLAVSSLPSLPAGSNQIGSVEVDSTPGTAAEGSGLPSELLVVAGDDGTDTHPIQLNGDDLKTAIEQWNAGTLPVTDNGGFTLAANDGTDIGDVGIEDISAVTGQASKSASLPVTLASDEDTVPTEQQSPVKVEDSSGTTIDPATEGKLESVRALLDDLDDALASVASDTLRTEQQSPVGVEDTSGTQIDPASNPEIRGGATLQDVVDAIDQGALAQIAATEEETLLTDATTAQTTSVQTTTGYKGVLVFVNIDAISGTSPELTAKIQRQTPGGVTQDVLSTGTLSSAGLTTLQVHPSLTDSANERAGELLGRDWQVDVSLKTSAGDESYQYDIEYTYIE